MLCIANASAKDEASKHSSLLVGSSGTQYISQGIGHYTSCTIQSFALRLIESLSFDRSSVGMLYVFGSKTPQL
jgi:hypothetical protein